MRPQAIRPQRYSSLGCPRRRCCHRCRHATVAAAAVAIAAVAIAAATAAVAVAAATAIAAVAAAATACFFRSSYYNRCCLAWP